MKNISRLYNQPQTADFKCGAFRENGQGFLIDNNGNIVPVVALHGWTRRATREEINNKDFFISTPDRFHKGGEAKENEDLIVYDWNEQVQALNHLTKEARDKGIKALLSVGLISSRKI